MAVCDREEVRRSRRRSALLRLSIAFFGAWFSLADFSLAQQHFSSQWSLANTPLSLELRSSRQKLEMVVNTSREIIADQAFRRIRIHNQEMIAALPLEGGNRLQVSALKAGVSQVDLVGADDAISTLEVIVLGDVRELETIIQKTMPEATIELTPIAQGIIINGFVSSAEDVSTLERIAAQYFPSVINRVTVMGVHTIQLQVQIMEVSRTKLRTLGIDWALLNNSSDGIISTAAGVLQSNGSVVAPTGTQTFNISVIDGNTRFQSAIEALHRNNLVKVLATPTLTAVDGRPASFNSGGEIPILVPAGLGQVGIQFREFGTRLDYVAKVLGNGKIYLEVRPYVSEIDPTRSISLDGISVPGLRSRFLETGVELHAGQTLALGGLIQLRTETINAGIPGLMEVPYLGALFRKTREEQNEVELLITVTPDFAGPLDPQQIPCITPGTSTQSPNDRELYMKGYMETPVTSRPQSVSPAGMFESVPPSMNPTGSTNSPLSGPSTISVGPNAPTLVETQIKDVSKPPFQTAVTPQSSNYR